MENHPGLIPGGARGRILAAWRLVLDYPLPRSWRKHVWNGNDAASNIYTAVAVLLIGYLYGLLPVILARVLGTVLSDRASALLFALLGLLFLEGKESGRGLLQICSWADRWLRKSGPDFSNSGIGLLQSPLSGGVAVLVVLAKFAALYILFRLHGGGCLPMVLVLTFATQLTLTSLPDMDTGEPVLPLAENGVWILWIAAGFLVLLVPFPLDLLYMKFVLFPLAAVGAWAMWRHSLLRYNATSIALITRNGAWMELGLLLLCLLLV